MRCAELMAPQLSGKALATKQSFGDLIGADFDSNSNGCCQLATGSLNCHVLVVGGHLEHFYASRFVVECIGQGAAFLSSREPILAGFVPVRTVAHGPTQLLNALLESLTLRLLHSSKIARWRGQTGNAGD